MKPPTHSITVQNTLSENNTFIPTRAGIKRWIHCGLSDLTQKADVCLRIVDKSTMQELNNTYRKKDKPTNVLSFPAELPEFLQEKFLVLGDIILCADVINEEAIEQQKEPINHWTHLVLHGLLHLRGYDHIEESDAIVMEAQEIKLLATLDIENPYQT